MHEVIEQDNILTESFKKINLIKNQKNISHFITKNIVDDAPSDISKLQNRLPCLNQIMHVLLDLKNNNGYTKN